MSTPGRSQVRIPQRVARRVPICTPGRSQVRIPPGDAEAPRLPPGAHPQGPAPRRPGGGACR